MKKVILITLLFCLTATIHSKKVSTGKAVLCSAVIPGLGELYLKEYNKAVFFFGAEAAIIFSYLRLKSETDWAIDSYMQFAYAKTDVPKNSDDSYYQIIQDYISSDNYNESIIRDARNYFLIYMNDPLAYEEYLEKYLVPEDMEWNWQNNTNWLKYKELRRDKQDLELYAKFTFAAAILNRIVSVIDTAISAKKINKTGKSYGELSFNPDWDKKGIKVNYEFHF